MIISGKVYSRVKIFEIHSSVHPDMCAGLTTYGVKGIPGKDLQNEMWKESQASTKGGWRKPKFIASVPISIILRKRLIRHWRWGSSWQRGGRLFIPPLIGPPRNPPSSNQGEGNDF